MIWGFLIGLAISFGLSYLAYVIAPKPKNRSSSSGGPPPKLEDPTAEVGRAIPVVFGTVNIVAPNVIYFADKERIALGRKSNPNYAEYYMTVHYGLCQGPIDGIRRVRIKEKTALAAPESGRSLPMDQEVDFPEFFGGGDREGGIAGRVLWQPGSYTQTLPGAMAEKYGESVAEHPAYRGIATVMFTARAGQTTHTIHDVSGFWWGTAPFISPADFMVTRIPSGWYPSKAAIALPPEVTKVIPDELTGVNSYLGPDANPAHIIREYLTNPVWGAGQNVVDLDDTSFSEAADVFYSEGLGLSLQWDVQREGEALIQDVQDHCEVVLFVSPRTGLWTLRALRGGYVKGSLPSFDESNSQVVNAIRTLPGEIPNELVVSWTNPNTEKAGVVTVHNPAGVAQAGQVISDNRRFEGLRNSWIAWRVAERELSAVSEQMFTGEVETNRSAWNLVPGDVFRLTSEEHEIWDRAVRIIGIDYGNPREQRVRINFVDDIFGRLHPDFDAPGQGGVPTQPRNFNITQRDGGALLDWDTPRDDGGSPIIRYEYQQNFASWRPASGLNTSHLVTNLINGNPYTFRVRAVNRVGPGIPTVPLHIGPSAVISVVPGVPLNFGGFAFGEEIEIFWSEPTSDGGATIIRYEYELDASGAWIPIPEGHRFIHRITGLSTGFLYEIRLRAVNSVGEGPNTYPIHLELLGVGVAYERPPQPEGLHGVSGIGVVLLTWENPLAHYRNHVRTVVYRHTSDDFVNATEVGNSTGISYADLTVADDTDYWYWIAWQSIAGIIGPQSDPVMVHTSIDPEVAIREISKEILDDPLTAELLAPIDTPLPVQRISEKLAQEYARLLGGIFEVIREDVEGVDVVAAALTALVARVVVTESGITATTKELTALEVSIGSLATAAALSTLTTEVTQNESSLSALSDALTQLEASLGETTASALQSLTARVTKAEGLTGGTELAALARWAVKLSVGDLTGGIGLLNDGATVKLYVAADRFAIIPPGDTDTDERLLPFVVSGGHVYINSAVIRNASISTVKIANAFLTNLTAVHGTLGFAQIDKGNVFDLSILDRIQSDNFSETEGWRITRDGVAIFDLAHVRGTLSAAHIDSDVRNVVSLWRGTRYAGTENEVTQFPISGGGLTPQNYDVIEGTLRVQPSNYNVPWSMVVSDLPTAPGATKPTRVGQFAAVSGSASKDSAQFLAWRNSSGTIFYITPRGSNDEAYFSDILGIRNPSGIALPVSSGTTTPVTDTRDTDYVYRKATSTPSAPSGGTTSESHTPSGWSRTEPDPTATENVYRASRTRTFRSEAFQSATSWGSVTLVANKTGVVSSGTSSRSRTFYRRGTSAPSAPTLSSFGAYSSVSGWSTSNPGPTTTQNVYAVTLTQYFTSPTTQTSSTFSRNGWGSVTVAADNTGGTSANRAPTANAGADKNILNSQSVKLFGTGSDPDQAEDTLRRQWAFVSGPVTARVKTPSGSWSTTVSNMSEEGTYVFRITVTDRGGLSDTDDVSVIVTHAGGK